jgi:hypothetical protein
MILFHIYIYDINLYFLNYRHNMHDDIIDLTDPQCNENADGWKYKCWEYKFKTVMTYVFFWVLLLLIIQMFSFDYLTDTNSIKQSSSTVLLLLSMSQFYNHEAFSCKLINSFYKYYLFIPFRLVCFANSNIAASWFKWQSNMVLFMLNWIKATFIIFNLFITYHNSQVWFTTVNKCTPTPIYSSQQWILQS